LVDENGLARSDGAESGSSPVPFAGGAQELASPEDVIAFQARFARLLERRTAIYTMGDSSSVPKHVAVDLLRSVCFVLGIDPDDPTVPPELLSVDLDAEFRSKLAEIERKVELTGRLWRDACAGMPKIPNIALQDTLASIGDFPRRYDHRSMAHEIPCTIDYPLCHPVAESLVGVDYINEYLRRLILEGDFLRRFELGSCVRILASTCPDYRGLLINLYEPIATNAIGLAAIGQDPIGLDVSDLARTEIARRLGPLGASQRRSAMHEAALAVCLSLGIRDDRATEYLCDLASDLLPRVEVGLSRGDLRGVFVSCGASNEPG
jgi:hypothetical protein